MVDTIEYSDNHLEEIVQAFKDNTDVERWGKQGEIAVCTSKGKVAGYVLSSQLV